MPTFVALFRAINLGSHNKIGMAALKEMHEAMGLKKVATYLQTGNLVFESDESDPLKLSKQIDNELEKKFGFRTEVIVRTSAELKKLPAKNPFLDQPDKATKWVVVMFLTACPDEQAQKDLLNSYKGPEEIVIKDKELFLYYSEGIGRSKLTIAFIEKKLKVLGTGRNWNTVAKLLEMTRD